jgi:hypothetical protein
VQEIAPFLEWADSQRTIEDVRWRSDDAIIGMWMRQERQVRPLATVPSLIDHPDEQPSLIGRRARAGSDRARVAACWLDPACDARTIDWTAGP